jgi:NAD(P)H dehydrogenase (quinone)
MATKILVTGASGQYGQDILNHLLALQSTDKSFTILAGTRSPAKLESRKAQGIEVRTLDFSDPSTFEAAFKGVDRLVLISVDTIGQRFVQHKAAIDAAVKAGIKHILYTSAGTPLIDRPLYDEHFLTESYLTATTNIGFTFLRNALYQEALLHSLPSAIQQQNGSWITSNGSGKRSYVTRSDLALAGAHAATDKYAGDSVRKIYELGGSELLSADEVAALTSQATGKTVTHTHVPAEKKIEILSNFLPPAIAAGLTAIEVHAAQGFDQVVTGDFARLVGREPHPLADFLKASKALLVGSPSS